MSVCEFFLVVIPDGRFALLRVNQSRMRSGISTVFLCRGIFFSEDLASKKFSTLKLQKSEEIFEVRVESRNYKIISFDSCIL